MGLTLMYGPAGKGGDKHSFHCSVQTPPKVQAGASPRVGGKAHLPPALSEQIVEPVNPLIHVLEPLSQLSPLRINSRSQFSPLGTNSRSQLGTLGINSAVEVEEAH